jgi:dipeptidyl aminopeptidase/acylaminoacyl peptidase
VDVLNAFSSLKTFKRVNDARIGMWGHSMGGHITLRARVV